MGSSSVFSFFRTSWFEFKAACGKAWYRSHARLEVGFRRAGRAEADLDQKEAELEKTQAELEQVSEAQLGHMEGSQAAEAALKQKAKIESE
jgi:hypothetical protein